MLSKFQTLSSFSLLVVGLSASASPHVALGLRSKRSLLKMDNNDIDSLAKKPRTDDRKTGTEDMESVASSETFEYEDSDGDNDSLTEEAISGSIRNAQFESITEEAISARLRLTAASEAISGGSTATGVIETPNIWIPNYPIIRNQIANQQIQEKKSNTCQDLCTHRVISMFIINIRESDGFYNECSAMGPPIDSTSFEPREFLMVFQNMVIPTTGLRVESLYRLVEKKLEEMAQYDKNKKLAQVEGQCSRSSSSSEARSSSDLVTSNELSSLNIVQSIEYGAGITYYFNNENPESDSESDEHNIDDTSLDIKTHQEYQDIAAAMRKSLSSIQELGADKVNFNDLKPNSNTTAQVYFEAARLNEVQRKRNADRFLTQNFGYTGGDSFDSSMPYWHVLRHDKGIYNLPCGISRGAASVDFRKFNTFDQQTEITFQDASNSGTSNDKYDEDDPAGNYALFEIKARLSEKMWNLFNGKQRSSSGCTNLRQQIQQHVTDNATFFNDERQDRVNGIGRRLSSGKLANPLKSKMLEVMLKAIKRSFKNNANVNEETYKSITEVCDNILSDLIKKVEVAVEDATQRLSQSAEAAASLSNETTLLDKTEAKKVIATALKNEKKRLMLQYHPDKGGVDENQVEKMKRTYITQYLTVLFGHLKKHM